MFVLTYSFHSIIYLSNDQFDHSHRIDDERILIIDRKANSVSEKLNKYHDFLRCHLLMKCFEKKSYDLQKQRRKSKKSKIVENKIESYIIFSFANRIYIFYQKINRKVSICVIKKKISRFHRITHENDDCFLSILTSNDLIEKSLLICEILNE